MLIFYEKIPAFRSAAGGMTYQSDQILSLSAGFFYPLGKMLFIDQKLSAFKNSAKRRYRPYILGDEV